MNNKLKNHPMFSQSDLDYFDSKGYSTDEILAFWDRDYKAGNAPCIHTPAFDLVGYLNS